MATKRPFSGIYVFGDHVPVAQKIIEHSARRGVWRTWCDKHSVISQRPAYLRPRRFQLWSPLRPYWTSRCRKASISALIVINRFVIVIWDHWSEIIDFWDGAWHKPIIMFQTLTGYRNFGEIENKTIHCQMTGGQTFKGHHIHALTQQPLCAEISEIFIIVTRDSTTAGNLT